MTTRRIVALAHGGAEAPAALADGPARAAEATVRAAEAGLPPLDAVVEGVRILEADPRFNAGIGSSLRLDGESLHMDASILDSTGRFGGVIGLHDVAHPILVARQVLDTPHVLLAGAGATAFARRMGHPAIDPRTDAARARLGAVRARAADPAARASLPWDPQHLRAGWNYPIPFEKALAGPAGGAPRRAPDADTVGVILLDGDTFAVGSSTGGMMLALLGRASDVCLPGCGLDASPHGAVLATGAGEGIVRARLGQRVLRLLEQGERPEEAARQALTWVEPRMALAVLALDREGRSAALGRSPFPWARAEGRGSAAQRTS